MHLFSPLVREQGTFLDPSGLDSALRQAQPSPGLASPRTPLPGATNKLLAGALPLPKTAPSKHKEASRRI